jgi:hypothetical protein
MDDTALPWRVYRSSLLDHLVSRGQEDGFANFFRGDYEKYARMAKELNITAE